MNQIIKSMVVASLLLTGAVAKDSNNTIKRETLSVPITDIQIFTTQNNDGKITPKTIGEAFTKAGFYISANRDMNGPFLKQFKESNFKTYNLFTFYKKDVVLELAKKYSNVGLFAPMSMSIYSKKGSNTLSISMLSAKAMAKIMKIEESEKLLLDLKKLVIDTVQKAMPNGKFEALPYKIQKPKGELVTTLTMEMDKDEWDEELEDFKMGFEGELASNGFIIAGQNNLGDDFEESNYTGFDFYEVYSICKLPVIYTIAKTRPEAGAFAPCSLYLEKKRDVNSMNIAFPSVYNWISSLAIDNKKDIETLEDAQKRMKKLLTSLTE
jgi:uncharacterized protein (DUF302 family)